MRYDELNEYTEPDDFFEMANLYPKTTGLPMTVWVSPKNSNHDIRIKVSQSYGNKMNISDTAVVGLRPTPKILAGKLSQSDFDLVKRWVSLNIDALTMYWNGDIDTIELGQHLNKI